MNIKQGSKYFLDIRHPRYSKNCKVILRNSKDSKGFLMDSKGFQKDSNGFQKDSNGFQKDSSGFQEDSNCLSPRPTKSIQSIKKGLQLLKANKRIPKYSKRNLTAQVICRPKDSKKFQKIPQKFQKIPKVSKRLQKLQKILMYSCSKNILHSKSPLKLKKLISPAKFLKNQRKVPSVAWAAKNVYQKLHRKWIL